MIWQFFLYQNSSAIESLAPSEIAQATGKTVAQVNQAIENLQDAGLLEFKTISIAGEIEMIFDVLPAFEKLDVLLTPKQAVEIVQPENDLKTLVGDFERELGRFYRRLKSKICRRLLRMTKLRLSWFVQP